MDDLERIRNLGRQGHCCSQILLTLGLELQGKQNPDLVRSMGGLCGGLGAGELCGALTGGACLLGLYAGKGTQDEDDDPLLLFMLDSLVEWFENEYGAEHGGIRCRDLLGADVSKKATLCPVMVRGVYDHVRRLLVENGFDLAGRDF